MYVQSLPYYPIVNFGRWKYSDSVAPGHTKGIKALSLSVGCNWSELKSTVAVFCLSAAHKQTLIS